MKRTIVVFSLLALVVSLGCNSRQKVAKTVKASKDLMAQGDEALSRENWEEAKACFGKALPSKDEELVWEVE